MYMGVMFTQVWVSTEAIRRHGPSEAGVTGGCEPPEMWVLGIKLRSSARAANAPNS